MNRNLYTKIAYWYYVLGLTQDEIAKRLGFTRQKVNQTINNLKKLDVVHITVRGLEEKNIALATALEETYGLKECIVVSNDNEDDDTIYKVSLVAAQYLENVIKNGDIIGVSWGNTLAKIAQQMNFFHKPDCKVVSLIGGLNVTEKISKTDEVARNFANKLDCPSVMLYAPLIVDNAKTKDLLMKEPHIKQSFDYMQRCNIALLGIGTLTTKTSIYSREVLSKENLSDNFVGDIATNLVRADGSWNSNPLQDRLISADIELLNSIENVVAVATGVQKADAIRGVLNSKCVNTLITDEATAKKILK